MTTDGRRKDRAESTVEQATPSAIRQLYELVEERRGTNGLYTIITSNLSIERLEVRWQPEGVAPGAFHEGMRVTDRLRESWGEQQTRGGEPAGGESGEVSVILPVFVIGSRRGWSGLL